MNLIKVISINFLSAVMIILIFEFIWGGWFFAENKKYCTYILCSFDVVFESPSTGKTKYSKDKFGLRGRKNINNDIDILIIGGSTADQKYVDDNATWDFFLERKFRESGKDIDIVNAAIDGQSSVGHIWNFQEWFVNIPNFSPRYILFYIGINDIAPRDIVRSFDGATETWKHVIKRNSVLYKIYFDFKFTSLYRFIFNSEDTRINDLNQLANNTRANHGANGTNPEYSDEFNYKKNNWTRYYKDVIQDRLIVNLEELVRLTNELGAAPIFVTQRTARWSLKNDKIFGDNIEGDIPDFKFKENTYKVSNADYGYAEKLISDSIMKFCKINNLYCINGFSILDINKNNTYDLVHTNYKGSMEIANKLYSELKDYIK